MFIFSVSEHVELSVSFDVSRSYRIFSDRSENVGLKLTFSYSLQTRGVKI